MSSLFYFNLKKSLRLPSSNKLYMFCWKCTFLSLLLALIQNINIHIFVRSIIACDLLSIRTYVDSFWHELLRLLYQKYLKKYSIPVILRKVQRKNESASMFIMLVCANDFVTLMNNANLRNECYFPFQIVCFYSRMAKCHDGTSRILCIHSWSCFVYCAENGSSQCGIVC